MKYSELTVGRVIECGSRLVTEDEMIAFATKYDPQPFHLDREFAAASQWGGLISSGWLSACVAMELFAKSILQGSESIGSPGFDEIRWHGPVRAGDVVSLRVIVLEQRPSSNGKYGVVRARWEMRNAKDEKVMHLIGISLFSAPQVEAAS